jgi:hypothetical protein
MRSEAARWLHRLPLPFDPDEQRAGYWWELSMRQVEVSRTIVLDAPRRARAFFEALIADNLDIGRPGALTVVPSWKTSPGNGCVGCAHRTVLRHSRRHWRSSGPV